MTTTTIKLRRDLAATWTSRNPVLNAGEQGYETDTGEFKIGDGSTAWISLEYFTIGMSNLNAPIADFSMSSHKITNITNGTNPSDAVNYSQLTSLAGGLNPASPVACPSMVSDILSSPPVSPVDGTSYLVASGASGLWAGLSGHLLEWKASTSLWIDILGRIIIVGDRLGINLESILTPSGSFTGKTFNLATITNATPGSYAYTFFPPINTMTTAIYGVGCKDYGHLYYYNDNTSSWVDFNIGFYPAAGTGLSFTGNIISIDTTITVDKTTSQTLTNKNLTSGTNTFPTFNQSTTGNAATATALQTARAINGVNFDGTTPITITAAAGTLTGTTLASNVLSSSLTSVGTLAALTVTATITGSVSGNAATATALTTSRNIDGIAFNGTSNITVIAPATVAASNKVTPVAADLIPWIDSASSNTLSHMTYANLLTAINASIAASTVGTFTSTDQTITSAGSLTIAHGLGVVPIHIHGAIVCQTSELGYSIGDIVQVAVTYYRGTGNVDNGLSIVADATNLNIRFSSNGSNFTLINKSNGNGGAITNTRWKLRLYAGKIL
jgi:hypothetical protein